VAFPHYQNNSKLSWIHHENVDSRVLHFQDEYYNKSSSLCLAIFYLLERCQPCFDRLDHDLRLFRLNVMFRIRNKDIGGIWFALR
jgi:hypothetical protein